MVPHSPLRSVTVGNHNRRAKFAIIGCRSQPVKRCESW